MFSTARPAEIVRCNQKDDYYASFIKGSLADVTQSLLGARSWLQWRKELDLAADVLYFGLTTLAGFQTLGEEYVNIIQVDSTLRRLQSPLRRGLMILLQVAAPYCIDRLLESIERRAEQNADGRLTSGMRTALIAAIPLLRHVIALVHRCHLAAFYLRGVFYHVAKRLVGTRYIQVRRGSSETSQSNYRILGWLSLAQLGFTFLQQVYRLATTDGALGGASSKISLLLPGLRRNPSTDRVGKLDSSAVDDAPYNASLRCSLCLENRKSSTATPCGHLYCWDCIAEWCATKAECPLCRDPFTMSRLICLQNYDPL